MPVKNNDYNSTAMLILTLGVVFVYVFSSWVGWPLIVLGIVMFVLK